MRWHSRSIFALALLLMVCTGYTSAYAEPLYQPPSLDGKTILFAIDNREGNPFNTEAEGASRFASILARGGANVDILNWSAPIPPETDLVVLAGAEFNYGGDRVARLWSFIETGGNVLLFLDPPRERRSVLANNPFFSLLWSDFGMRISDIIAINPRQDALPLAPDEVQNAEGTPFPTTTAIPYTIPPQFIDQFSSSNNSHPILQDVAFESLAFDGLRPLEMRSFLANATVTELLVTDEQPYGESDYTSFAEAGVYHFDDETDQSRRSFVAAIASENSLTGGRIVVIGDGAIARNNFGFSTSPPTSEAFIYADSARLVLNAAYWLLDADAPVLTLATAAPTPTRTITPSPSPTMAATEGISPAIPPAGSATIEIPLPPVPTQAAPG